jgi:hypothetical protein
MTFGFTCFDFIDWTILITEIVLIYTIVTSIASGFWQTLVLILLIARFVYIIWWDFLFDLCMAK